LHVNLCTYADVRGAGATVVGFVELAIDLAARAGIPLRIRVDREDARRPKAGRRLTEQTWRKIRQLIAQGDYTTLLVFNDSTLGLTQATLPYGVTTFSLAVQTADLYEGILARIHNPAARERVLQAARPNPRFINLAVGFGTGGIQLDTDELQQVVQGVQATFRAVRGACGLITLDPFQFISGDMTQDELARRVYWANAPDIYQTHLRGVFWGNLLSPRHVELLGGYARVARDAPCQIIAPLQFDQQPAAESRGAYLQLTEHPAQVSDEQLEALSRYLAPLLP
jgi:hypothetical protein